MRKPRALRAGDRVAIVAPASPFARDGFDRGVEELRALGFDPVFEESVFDRSGYLAGSATSRAAAFQKAWADPSIAAIVAARGGYGSVHLLPLLDRATFRSAPKAFLGYSDNTSLLTWLNQACGMVAFHGPMVEGRFGVGETAYDRDTFTRCVCRAEPAGEITAAGVEVFNPGEAAGMLTGGTLAKLTASLGTPYAFDPPPGSVLFLEDVAERPYRLDRMLTQLRLAGVFEHAAGLVFGTMPGCEEPGGAPPAARDVIADLIAGFRGPVLYGLPSGHTDGPMLTLPFGVRARVVTHPRPAIIIEEAAVTAAAD
jgi:muramoyltetrapeptide carboxypeptidase